VHLGGREIAGERPGQLDAASRRAAGPDDGHYRTPRTSREVSAHVEDGRGVVDRAQALRVIGVVQANKADAEVPGSPDLLVGGAACLPAAQACYRPFGQQVGALVRAGE
jgi:hypothetical protein